MHRSFRSNCLHVTSHEGTAILKADLHEMIKCVSHLRFSKYRCTNLTSVGNTDHTDQYALPRFTIRPYA